MARIEIDVLLGDRYRLLQRIATGGMGTVWEAEDTVLHRRVAVKILSEALSSDEHFIERFRREARAAAGLSHPSVARVFDYGVDEGTHFIVLELIEGETLAARLSDGPLPWQEAVRIIARVAAALESAHRAGVVHRDVKPGNIMLTPDGGVKVMDFGIAAAAWAVPITASGTTMGTATYISPEQAAGRRATAASDVYSMGVVLYEMLAGRPPFRGDSPVAVATAHVRDDPPPIRRLAPGVPANVATACERALSKDPSNRPSSAAAFISMLRDDTGQETAPFIAGLEDEPTVMLSPQPGTAVLPTISPTGTPPEGVATVAESPHAMEAAPRAGGRAPEGRTPRRGRGSWGWLLVAFFAALAIVLVVVAIILASRTTNPSSPPTSPGSSSPSQGTVVMPNVVGMKEGDARDALMKLGFTTFVVTKVAGPDGTVISSNPTAGSTVAPTTPVTLYVGSTPSPKPKPSHHGKGKGGG